MRIANAHKACLMLFLCSTIAFVATCKSWTQRGAKGITLLPKASPAEKNFSSYRPHNEYRPLVAGLLTRTLVDTAIGEGYRVEVRDLLVGPRQHTEIASLHGGAVFEVRSGHGAMAIGEKRQELRLGSTLSLAEGQTFVIDNSSEIPLTIRAFLFRAG